MRRCCTSKMCAETTALCRSLTRLRRGISQGCKAGALTYRATYAATIDCNAQFEKVLQFWRIAIVHSKIEYSKVILQELKEYLYLHFFQKVGGNWRPLRKSIHTHTVGSLVEPHTVCNNCSYLYTYIWHATPCLTAKEKKEQTVSHLGCPQNSRTAFNQTAKGTRLPFFPSCLITDKDEIPCRLYKKI